MVGRLVAVVAALGASLLACVETQFADGGATGVSGSPSGGASTNGGSSAGGSASSGGAPASGTGGAGGEPASTNNGAAGGAGGGGAGSGGEGGTGGSPPVCGPGEVEAAPACAPSHTFDSIQSFEAGWNTNGPGDFDVAAGTLSIALAAGQTLTWAETEDTFDFENCAVWVRVAEPPDVPTTSARLSIGIQQGNSLYNVNLIGEKVVGKNMSNPDLETAVNPNVTRFIRMREHAGLVWFGHSEDGVCWTEFGSFPFTQANSTMYGRLTLTKSVGSPDELAFDDFCVQP